jgi:hypothetical protein
MTKKLYLMLGVAIAAIAFAVGVINHAQSPQKTDPATQQKMDEMNKRGDRAMGFDHLKTTHHFILTSDGGVIQVEANDANDQTSRDQIRMHFHHIAMMFSDGDFDVPMLVHAETPPGVEVMRKLKTEITYRYKETERGAMVQISTKNPDALNAVHEFLRYQNKEHMTGDPLDVKSNQ